MTIKKKKKEPNRRRQCFYGRKCIYYCNQAKNKGVMKLFFYYLLFMYVYIPYINMNLYIKEYVYKLYIVLAGGSFYYNDKIIRFLSTFFV